MDIIRYSKSTRRYLMDLYFLGAFDLREDVLLKKRSG